MNDFEDYFKATIAGLIVIAICGFITCLFLPRPHQGYYLEVRDGANSSQIYPTYRIVNNWKWYPDSAAFESADKDECLKIYNILKD